MRQIVCDGCGQVVEHAWEFKINFVGKTCVGGGSVTWDGWRIPGQHTRPGRSIMELCGRCARKFVERSVVSPPGVWSAQLRPADEAGVEGSGTSRTTVTREQARRIGILLTWAYERGAGDILHKTHQTPHWQDELMAQEFEVKTERSTNVRTHLPRRGL